MRGRGADVDPVLVVLKIQLSSRPDGRAAGGRAAIEDMDTIVGGRQRLVSLELALARGKRVEVEYPLGRYVYGLAAIASGLCGLMWHQFDALGSVPHREMLACIAAAIEIVGGAAVLWPRTARAAAIALAAVSCAFALVGVPAIVKQPFVYNNYGNFFEQFSLGTGALILLGCLGRTKPAQVAWIGYYGFGMCLVSFALEQLFYLAATASLVPKWIPPGQKFWAIATTAAFALAAVALLTGVLAQLAARLTTAMLVGFGVLVWLPAIFADAHSFVNWSETTETFAITASAWMVAEFAGQRRSSS